MQRTPRERYELAARLAESNGTSAQEAADELKGAEALGLTARIETLSDRAQRHHATGLVWAASAEKQHAEAEGVARLENAAIDAEASEALGLVASA